MAEDTLSLLKFSFGGDEGVAQSDIEKAGSFHELFNLVLNKLYHGDTAKALSRIVYMLDHVSGHRRYGVRSVNLLTSFGIDKPPRHREEEQPLLVQLYHCLAAVASRLNPDHEESIRNIMAKSLGISPKCKKMETIPTLFGYMIHEKRITVENQDEAVELLFNVRAKQTITYLKKYRQRNGLSLSSKLLNAGLFAHCIIL